jgi:hypothetical protein
VDRRFGAFIAVRPWNDSREVHQKDLGPDTAKIAAMELYNPDKTWHRTDDGE